MSFTIVDAREPLPTRPPFMTIYGEPGVGKTSLSLTMPGNTLLIDADEGASRAVKQLRASQTLKIDKYGDFWKWFASKEAEDFLKEKDIESLIIDTVGTLLEDKVTPWLIQENPKAGKSDGSLSLSGWGALGTHFGIFKNRCVELNLKVLAICHGKEDDVQDAKRARLAVKGGTKDLIPRVSDMLGFVYLHGKDRVVDFNASAFHIGKNTAGLPMLKIPLSSSKEYENFMADVYEATVEKMEESGLEQVEFLKLLDEYREGLDECNEAKDFDAFISTLSEEEDKLVVTQIRTLLSEAMTAKGLKYDKKEGKVVSIEEEKAKA